jgi:hypothetical protein
MESDKNDNKKAALAFISTLTKLELGNSFLAKVNTQIKELITILVHYLLSPKNSHKRGDFLIDLSVFVTKMKNKYATDEPFGHSPLSPFEKLMLRKNNAINDREKKVRVVQDDEYGM